MSKSGREGWKETTLGEMLTFQVAFDITKNQMQPGQYDVIFSSGFGGTHNGFKVKAPGVVIGRKGTLGTVFFAERNFWATDTTLWVKNFHGNDERFAYYFLQTLHLEQYDCGASNPTLNRNHIHPISVCYPNVHIQKKIAAILANYDRLIENNTRRIKTLEEMARSLYREWFVNFRFPGYEQVKMVDSELGLIPEGWEVVQLENLYRTSSGGTPSRKNLEFYGGSIRWIKTRELNDSFIFEVEETITELGLQKSSAKLFPENTVIIAMYGATIGQLGILAHPATTNQACCAVLNNNDLFSYAYAFLYFLENREKIIALGMGAAQQNISQQVIKKFEIFKPTPEIIKRFNNIVNPTLEEIKVLQHKNVNLRCTRDLLLPKLISGEINVESLDINKGDIAV